MAQLGFGPNIYSYLAKHPNALADYLAFIGRKSKLAVSITINRGKPDKASIKKLMEAGDSEHEFIDAVFVIRL